MKKHERGCMQPTLNIIHYDENRKQFWIDLPDAPVAGPNDVYYCPTCGVKLEYLKPREIDPICVCGHDEIFHKAIIGCTKDVHSSIAFHDRMCGCSEFVLKVVDK